MLAMPTQRVPSAYPVHPGLPSSTQHAGKQGDLYHQSLVACAGLQSVFSWHNR